MNSNWFWPTLIVFFITLGGCVTAPPKPDNDSLVMDTLSVGPMLRIEGESVVLGNAVGIPISLQVFVARIEQLLVTGADAEVGELVRIYPDLAEQAIFSPNTPVRSQQVIAAWLDVLATPAQGGWSTFIADRIERPQYYQTWEEYRSATWSVLNRGAFAEIADQKLNLPTDGPTPWPTLDAVLLQATATLAAGHPTDAATHFEQVAELAMDWDQRIVVRASLFAALAHQLAGNVDASLRNREIALNMLSLASIQDPLILRLLLETHGATSPISRRVLLARLGQIELEREVPQSALLTWRAAETEPGTEPTRNRLRLNQAEALIALGQEEPAIAMLIGLAQTDIRAEALVMLGLVQLRRGQVNVALPILREAIAATNAQLHPNVYADSGFALLSIGERVEGYALVQQARAAYIAQNDTQALRRLLTNELHYAQAVGDAVLLQKTRQALLNLHINRE